MTDITDFSSIPVVRRSRPATVPLPVPVPFDAPVLIGDCITPLSGETILSLIWRRLDRQNKKRPSGGLGRDNH